MAYRRNKALNARDNCIRTLFYDCIGNRKMKVMDAYSYCGEYYDLSEESIKKIVHRRNR